MVVAYRRSYGWILYPYEAVALAEVVVDLLSSDMTEFVMVRTAGPTGCYSREWKRDRAKGDAHQCWLNGVKEVEEALGASLFPEGSWGDRSHSALTVVKSCFGSISAC